MKDGMFELKIYIFIMYFSKMSGSQVSYLAG